MKKYLGLFIVLVVTSLVLSTSVVKAENGNTTNTGRPVFNDDLKVRREAFKDTLEARREAFKEQLEADRKAFNETLKTDREAFKAELKIKKEEFRSANAGRKVGFCQAAKNMIGQRFEVAIRNLERMQTRVADVIEKLHADGKDTTVATESYDLSKQKLADAQTKLLEIKSLIPENCQNITPEIFEQIKLGARDAKNLLKESRNNLVQAIKEIGNLRGEEDDADDEETQ